MFSPKFSTRESSGQRHFPNRANSPVRPGVYSVATDENSVREYVFWFFQGSKKIYVFF